MIFRLEQSDALESGDIILDKDNGIIFYRDIVDWLKFLEEYNEDFASAKNREEYDEKTYG